MGGEQQPRGEAAATRAVGRAPQAHDFPFPSQLKSACTSSSGDTSKCLKLVWDEGYAGRVLVPTYLNSLGFSHPYAGLNVADQ